VLDLLSDGVPVTVIINPASGRGKGRKAIPVIQRCFADHGIPLKIVETERPGQAVSTGEFVPGSAGWYAAEAVSKRARVIIAAGGDGTVGEVANALMGTPTALGILPVGTGNDMVRSLGISRNLPEAIAQFVHGRIRRIDAGRSPNGYFVNIAGVGFDAEVAHAINHRFRHLHGTTAYLVAVISTLARYRPQEIELEIDGVCHRERIMLCAVANAQSYGGGMRVAPTARLDSGKFEIVLVGDVSRWEFLKTFPSVFKGTHVSHPKVKVFTGESVQITSPVPLPVLADGEEIGSTPVHFSIVPSGLTVVVPTEG
jgi:diacylglycerol kinase (ATP)